MPARRMIAMKIIAYDDMREKLVENLVIFRMAGVSIKATPSRHTTLTVLPRDHAE